jgi:hypothetical protein
VKAHGTFVFVGELADELPIELLPDDDPPRSNRLRRQKLALR